MSTRKWLMNHPKCLAQLQNKNMPNNIIHKSWKNVMWCNHHAFLSYSILSIVTQFIFTIRPVYSLSKTYNHWLKKTLPKRIGAIIFGNRETILQIRKDTAGKKHKHTEQLDSACCIVKTFWCLIWFLFKCVLWYPRGVYEALKWD